MGRPTAWSPTFGKSILGGSGPSCHPSEGQRWTDRPVLRDYARLCTVRCQEVASTLASWAGGSQSPPPPRDPRVGLRVSKAGPGCSPLRRVGTRRL